MKYQRYLAICEIYTELDEILNEFRRNKMLNRINTMNTRTKLQHTLLAITLITAASNALADDSYDDRARVISVSPQTERINVPRQECRTEYTRESYNNDRSSPAGAIIGGLAGGLLGNTVGRGNGRIAAAVVGAGLGAVVGDRVGNNQSNNSGYNSRPVERCYSVDNWQTVNSGYLVSYRYNGRDYTTVMDRQPGDTIPVHVGVTAATNSVSQISYSDNNSRYDNRPRDWDHDRRDRHDW